ncbi:MAG TPA: [acyl-carrier-protein] S-malonyltransferase [Gammaproteobacteria bacterium]|nr:[acyl-carrier-protein] S-malonyltransferase [Gammaproteobacteria bacterium]
MNAATDNTDDTLAIVFPGQGSQSVGMLSWLAASYPLVNETFTQASDVLGYDLWKLSQDGPKDELNRTDRTQPAMLAAGVAVWRVWQQENGALPGVMAGHSLGEYSALVCAGAMEFSDAVSLVEERGRCMQSAVPAGVGAMAAILGLDDETVADVCNRAAESEVVSPVNFNSPGQVVIAGNAEAVQRAIVLAKEAGAKRALPLAVSVPSHCSLMQPAAEQFAARLARTNISTPSIPVIQNVDADRHDQPDAIRKNLEKQLYRPVQWVLSVQNMGGQGVTRIIEAGPGKVLAGLCKRIDKSIASAAVFDPASLAAALDD